MNTQNPKPNDVKGDMWHKSLSQTNTKEATIAFLGEFGIWLIFYGVLGLLGTVVGVMIWVGIWFGVLLIPLAVTLYYLFKKYQNQNHEKI